MDRPCWIIRAQNQALHVRRTEVKYARFAMIDPNHCVIVMLVHECFLFAINQTSRSANT
jgi:hypothetical protein